MTGDSKTEEQEGNKLGKEIGERRKKRENGSEVHLWPKLQRAQTHLR